MTERLPVAQQSWFDAHLDLACLAVHKRDMSAPADEAGGPWPPGAVTLPSLREGGVCAAFGTIFTEAGGEGPEGYPEGDVETAHRRGRAQLEVYLTWRDQGRIALDIPKVFRHDPGVGTIRGGMGVAEVSPLASAKKLDLTPRGRRTLHVGVLMESADPIRSPVELPWWVERGVMAIGLAWWKSSRYAGGNGASGEGLTPAGRELVDAMDELGVAHDLSHLSQRATEELLEAATGPVMASHSNCRALLGGENERHLTDETIAEIGRRGGVVGINLVSNFLDHTLEEGKGQRATIDDVVAHIERVCEIMGRRDGVGLGSDMDGGFSRTGLPEGIEGPKDLERIADALRARGWSDAEIGGFRFENWGRFCERLAARPAATAKGA